uniref:Fibronectin type-III domain-containing protein n=1 Tax=Callorhinchus milii TaxID=7868 RepID=A0A4W3JF50_CALMI
KFRPTRESNACPLACEASALTATLPASTLMGVRRSHLSNPLVQTSECEHREVVECLVPSVLPDNIYWVWLTARSAPASLISPLMVVTPGNIVKPSAPRDLRWEVTTDGFHRLGWAGPKPPPFPLRYQLRYSSLTPEAAWQLQVEVSYTVQVRCVRRTSLGVWSDWSSPTQVDVQVTYQPSRVVTVPSSTVTVRCIFYNKMPGDEGLVWLLNMVEKVPEDQYTLVSEHESRVTLWDLPVTSPGERGHVLQCCPNSTRCNYRYTEIFVVGESPPDPKLTHSLTRSGSETPPAYTLDSLSLSLSLTHSHSLSFDCAELGGSEARGEMEECGVWRNEEQQCHVRPIHLLSAHVMWLEIHLPEQTLRSAPTCLIPMDVVKPWPPAGVNAEVTVPEGLLRVSWQEPRLPPYPLSCQLRYSASSEPAHWRVLGTAMVALADPCEVYVAGVRCRRSEGPGRWSEWSESARTEPRDLQAPTTGPDFWRLLTTDPASGQTNVTLVWKRLTQEEALCSVGGFSLRSLSSWGSTRLERVGDGAATTYTFPLTPDLRTVSLIAFNSVGPSTNNYNLTLWPDGGEVHVLRSLHAWQMNGSCAVVTWILAEGRERPWEYVVEWDKVSPGVGGHLKWLRTSGHINQVHLYGRWSWVEGVEGGESKPKGIVKKLMWQEIPNPNKCSWAQGVDFSKVRFTASSSLCWCQPGSAGRVYNLQGVHSVLLPSCHNTATSKYNYHHSSTCFSCWSVHCRRKKNMGVTGSLWTPVRIDRNRRRPFSPIEPILLFYYILADL